MKILCPIDFSDHSKIALEYAFNLSNSLNADLHVISVFQVRKTASSFVSLDDIIKKNHEEDMAKVISGLGLNSQNDKLPITKVIRGSTVDSILGYAKSNSIDLIIMGSQGSNSIKSIFFGSTAKKTVLKSEIPIIVIPETIAHRLTSNRVVFALDNKEINEQKSFETIKSITSKLGLKIDLLHIETEDEDLPFDPFINAYLEGHIGEVILKKANDPIKEIKSYVEQSNVGLLIMLRRKKSFLKELLTIGNTESELAITNTPLLILPEE